MEFTFSTGVGYGGFFGVSLGFSSFFALRPDGRECSFFSPRALTAMSCRGLRGCRSRREVDSRVTRHQHRVQGLPIHISNMCTYTRCERPSLKQQQQQHRLSCLSQSSSSTLSSKTSVRGGVGHRGDQPAGVLLSPCSL